MARQLHVLRRLEPENPDPLAADIVGSSKEHEVRVLELFDAPVAAMTADLSLAERDLPELVTVLLWAEEIHVHAIAPEFLLATLPALRADAFVRTALVLHGPWFVPDRPIPISSAGIHRWPGPVWVHDVPDAAVIPADDVRPLGPRAKRCFLDPARATLLPSCARRAPYAAQDCPSVFLVVVGADVPAEPRAEFTTRLPRCAPNGSSIEVVDETTLRIVERSAVRRVAHAYVTVRDEQPASRWVQECRLQGVPMHVLERDADAAWNLEPVLDHVRRTLKDARERT